MTFLKNRPQGKKMGIILLIAIIVIALAEIGFRIVFIHESLRDIVTHNLGEQLVIIILASTILLFNAKGKDRICYLCYTAWIGYFVLDQLFQLPRIILDIVPFSSNVLSTSILVPVFYLVSLISIVVLGILLVEYMNDGSIYNRAFNVFSVIGILSILASIIVNIAVVINSKDIAVLLSSFHNLYRLAMVFMFTFFAYDSAKMQLKKTNLTK